MTKIGLISDTHGILLDEILNFTKNCDEIWHAGDWGSIEIYNKLKKQFKVVRGVYGNIDGKNFNTEIPEIDIFYIENIKVIMTHIGGYPGKYEKKIKDLLQLHQPKLFISGHSHILKIIFDKKYNLLHINPGAAGKTGFHKSISAIRFEIDKDNIRNLEVFDLKRK